MRSLTTASFILMALAMANASARASAFEASFLDSLYDDVHRRDDKDYILRLIVDEKTTDIDVHSSVFRNIESLNSLFADEKSIVIPLQSQAEASALKKAIYFLYKNIKPDEYSADPRIAPLANFFEAFDLSETIFCAWKYQIDSLNLAIALFVHKEVQRKLQKPSQAILLDQLPQSKLDSLYSALNGVHEDTYKKDPAMESLRTSVDYYAHLVYFNKDPRIKAERIRINPNIYNQISAHHSQLKKQQKLDEEAMAEKRRVEALEHEAQESATEIYDKVCGDLARKRNRIAPKNYWVSASLDAQVVRILQQRLPEFDIFLDPGFGHLTPGTHLTQYCDKPCSAGSCLAQSVGWVGWALLYVPQLLTCDFCIPCAVKESDRPRINDGCTGAARYEPDPCAECFGGCQSGAVIAHGVYNAATCYRRSIRIQPKKVDKNGLRLPPAPSL